MIGPSSVGWATVRVWIGGRGLVSCKAHLAYPTVFVKMRMAAVRGLGAQIKRLSVNLQANLRTALHHRNQPNLVYISKLSPINCKI